MKDKYVLIDLRLNGSESPIRWMIHNDHQRGKIIDRDVKDTIDYILADPTIGNATPESKVLADEMREFIRETGKGFYEVGTVDGRVMACKVDINTLEVKEDQRTILLRDILLEQPATIEGKNVKILYQELIIAEPTFLG